MAKKRFYIRKKEDKSSVEQQNIFLKELLRASIAAEKSEEKAPTMSFIEEEEDFYIPTAKIDTSSASLHIEEEDAGEIIVLRG